MISVKILPYYHTSIYHHVTITFSKVQNHKISCLLNVKNIKLYKLVPVNILKFSLNINGELAGYFGSTRGLRQGDPVSSYLFVLITKALSRLLKKRIEEDPGFVYH